MIKETAISILICASIFSTGQAQELSKTRLVGLWQANEYVLGSGYGDIYRFYSNGTFEFSFSEFVEYSRIRSIHGNYALKDGQIYFKIKTRTEWVGGEIRRGGGWSSQEWILNGAKLAIIPQQSTDENEGFAIKPFENGKDGHSGIEIDGRKYYQLSNNPRSGLQTP